MEVSRECKLGIGVRQVGPDGRWPVDSLFFFFFFFIPLVVLVQLFGGRRGESWRYGRLLKTYVSGGGSPRSHGAAFNASKNYRGGNILCIEDCWNYYWNFNRCTSLVGYLSWRAYVFHMMMTKICRQLRQNGNIISMFRNFCDIWLKQFWYEIVGFIEKYKWKVKGYSSIWMEVFGKSSDSRIERVILVAGTIVVKFYRLEV